MKAGTNPVVLLAPTPRAGKITDSNGQPITGARVELYVADGRKMFLDNAPESPDLDVILSGDELGELAAPFRTQTDAKGEWTIEALPPRSRVALNVRAPGFASATLFLDPDEARKPLVLAPGARIEGRVLGLDGAPVAGVIVDARKSEGYGGGATATTDANGHYTLDGLEVGAFSLFFHAKDEAFVVPVIGVFNAKAGANTAPEAKAQRGVLVRGTVRDANGAPIETSVSAGEAFSTESDEKGNWQLRVMPGQNVFQLGLYEGKYIGERESKTLEIKEGETPVLDWKLVPAPKFSGVFVDEKGAPVKTALLLMPTVQDGQVARLQSDETGHFQTPVPFKGEAKISSLPYQPSDYEPVGNSSVTLPFKGELRVVVRRVAFKTFETKVVDQDGVPLAGVQFEAILWSGEGQNRSGASLRATSDQNGVLRFDKIALDQSPENASATKPGFDLRGDIKIVRQGASFTTTPIVLVARDGQAQGQVLGLDGQPAARARVCAAGVETRADEQGRFHIEGLTHGAQEVCALSADGQTVGFARASTGETTLKLAPATLQGRDQTLARQLMDELRADTKNTDYYYKDALDFEPTDFAARLKTSRYIGYEFGRARSAGVAIGTMLDAYLSLPKASDRLSAASAIVSGRDDWKNEARAGEFVARLEADAEVEMNSPLTDESAGRADSVLAAGAAREVLGQNDKADASFDRATKWIWKHFTNPKTTPEEVLAQNIGVFSFAPRALARAMELIDPESYSHSNAVFELTETLAQTRGLEAARPFLDAMTSAPDSQPNSQGNRFSLKANHASRLVNAIRAGGASNPVLALQMARALPESAENIRYDYRSQAIAEAAFFQDAATSKTLWREQVPTMTPNTAIRFAARIAPLDAELAKELYEGAREKMDATDLNANKNIWYLQANPARFAFYEALWNPARARYRLERSWPAKDLLAMGRVDVARAVEMARSIPSDARDFGGFEARRSLAQQLWDGTKVFGSNE